MSEPGAREFLSAVGHVFSAKDTEREHCLRSKVRREVGCEISTDWRSAGVGVPVLHAIMNNDNTTHGCGSTLENLSERREKRASVARRVV